MRNFTLAFLLALTAVSPAGDEPNGQTPTARQKIRVYPTPHRPGNLTVETSTQGLLWFYLFDLDGNLICQLPVSGRKQQVIEGLASGTYTYHAFYHDQNLKGGKVEIKTLNQ